MQRKHFSHVHKFVLVILLTGGCRAPESSQLAPGFESKAVLGEYPVGRWTDPITIPFTHNTGPACFILDTGFGINELDDAAFPNLQSTEKQAELLTTGGRRRMILYKPPEKNVGPFALARCGPVLCDDMSELRAVTGLPIVGIIGFPAMRNVLKKEGQFARRSTGVSSGLHLMRWKSPLVARFVDDASPAYDAGLRNGDIILQINSRPEADYSLSEIRDLLSSDDGREVTLKFRRKDHDQTVTFKPLRML